MEERYSRNRIYVRSEEQQFIRNYRILSGGAGIGGIIAECALRFGFAINTFIDADNVEELVKEHDIAINALDFKSNIPIVFDEWCQWIENKSRCVSFGTVPAFNLIAIYCS